MPRLMGKEPQADDSRNNTHLFYGSLIWIFLRDLFEIFVDSGHYFYVGHCLSLDSNYV